MAPKLNRAKLPQDAVREFRRCTQGNPMLDYELGEYKRLFEEDENMDESYKVLMLSLFSLGPELPQTENGNPSGENEHGDVRENVVQEKNHPEEKSKRGESSSENAVTKKSVLRKRASSEFKKRSTRGSRKAIIEESTELDDSKIAIIEIPSSSDEERDESDADTDGYDFYDDDCHERDADTDYYDFFDDDCHERNADTDYYDFFDDDCHKSEDPDMDMMKPRRSPKGRFAPKSRDVGESSRAATAHSEVEFRRRVLDIISKPYDMMEYMIMKKEFDSKRKRYIDDHPELGNELMKWRDNRRKELALMRGFYFWRKNLNREGAFKPWRDDVCLAVEPQPLSRGNESEN